MEYGPYCWKKNVEIQKENTKCSRRKKYSTGQLLHKNTVLK
jgi:hypothetical protein